MSSTQLVSLIAPFSAPLEISDRPLAFFRPKALLSAEIPPEHQRREGLSKTVVVPKSLCADVADLVARERVLIKKLASAALANCPAYNSSAAAASH